MPDRSRRSPHGAVPRGRRGRRIIRLVFLALFNLLPPRVELAQKAIEAKLGEDLRKPLLVGFFVGQGRIVDLHRNVAVQRDEIAADIGLLLRVAEVLAPLAPDLVGMGVKVIQAAVLANQLAGGLLADQRHARHIIDGIALQRQAIDDLLGRDSHLLLHRFAVGDFAGLDIVHTNVVVQQLQDVLVLRADQYVDPVLGGLLRERANDIVRLVAVQAQDRDLHRLENLPDAVHLARQVVRHRRPIGLVLRKNIDPESRRLAVHGHGDHVGLLLLDQPDQGRREDERRLGRRAGRTAELLLHRSEVSRVNMGVAVNYVKRLRHFPHCMSRTPACQALTTRRRTVLLYRGMCV